jgi:uncharacterized protein
VYCLDTYALWEIQYQNPTFSRFLTEEFVVTDWTMMEFYRTLLRKYDKQTADYWIKKLAVFCKSVELSILIEAAQFQHEHKKKRLSLFDCVGYMYAKKNKLLFVTGDKEFKEKESVLFLKKGTQCN